MLHVWQVAHPPQSPSTSWPRFAMDLVLIRCMVVFNEREQWSCPHLRPRRRSSRRPRVVRCFVSVESATGLRLEPNKCRIAPPPASATRATSAFRTGRAALARQTFMNEPYSMLSISAYLMETKAPTDTWKLSNGDTWQLKSWRFEDRVRLHVGCRFGICQTRGTR